MSALVIGAIIAACIIGVFLVPDGFWRSLGRATERTGIIVGGLVISGFAVSILYIAANSNSVPSAVVGFLLLIVAVFMFWLGIRKDD
jgi:hypothetical protein